MKLVRKGLCAFLRPNGFCLVRRDSCIQQHDYAPCRDAVRRVVHIPHTQLRKVSDIDLSSAKGRFYQHTKDAKGSEVYWSCKRKSRYPDENSARRAARKMAMRYGETMYHYFCKFCDGYHLTKKARRVTQEGEYK